MKVVLWNRMGPQYTTYGTLTKRDPNLEKIAHEALIRVLRTGRDGGLLSVLSGLNTPHLRFGAGS